MMGKIFTWCCFLLFGFFLVIYTRMAVWLVGLVLGFYWRSFIAGWNCEIFY